MLEGQERTFFFASTDRALDRYKRALFAAIGIRPGDGVTDHLESNIRHEFNRRLREMSALITRVADLTEYSNIEGGGGPTLRQHWKDREPLQQLFPVMPRSLELYMLMDCLYFIAWLTREIFQPYAFPGARTVDAMGITLIRNYLIQKRRKSGISIGAYELDYDNVPRMNFNPTPNLKKPFRDPGVFVNARELRRELDRELERGTRILLNGELAPEALPGFKEVIRHHLLLTSENTGEVLLIDPPIGPFATADQIRAWIHELKGMLARYTTPRNVAAINREIETAERWLAMQQDRA